MTWWLLNSLRRSGRNYAWVQWFFRSWIGVLVLFGFSWGLIHHSLGASAKQFRFGIRRRGFEPREREWLARATLIGSISLTLLAWIIGGFIMGGLR